MRDYEEKSYYEIQLDNKQLILVFLASVTVCVLIFILGVMVGKGQKETEMASVTTEPQNTRPQTDNRPPKEFQTDKANKEDKPRRKGAKEPVNEPKKQEQKPKENYTFYDLDKPSEKETLIKEPGKTEAAKTDPIKETKAEVAEEKTTPLTTQPGVRYTVQVMATSSKSKAQQQLSTLKTKGYTAFLDEDKGAGSVVYKVRVGKFDEVDSAKKIAAKLKQELKLETWVAVLD